MKKILGLVVMLGLLGIPAYATDNLTIPNTFNSGATISSSQMNENFSELILKINQIQDQLNSIKTKLFIDSLVLFSTSKTIKGGDILSRNNADNFCSNSLNGYEALTISTCTNISAIISISLSDDVNSMPSNYSINTEKPIIDISRQQIFNNWESIYYTNLNNWLCGADGIDCNVYWYGSNSQGSVSNTCDSWTNNSAQGSYANTQRNSAFSGQSLGNLECSTENRLLCICY